MAVLIVSACGGAPVATAVPLPAPTIQPPTVPPVTTMLQPTGAPASPTVAATLTPALAVTAPAKVTEPPASPAPTSAANPFVTNQDFSDIPPFIPADEWQDPTPGEFTRADVDYIFPPGRGQDLVFRDCADCHNWVPMVFSGYDRQGWLNTMFNHRERVSAMNDEDFEYVWEYLIRTWPPDRPTPDNIPKELLELWTSY